MEDGHSNLFQRRGFAESNFAETEREADQNNTESQSVAIKSKYDTLAATEQSK